MSLDLADRDLAPLLGRLRPYARALLARAGDHALRLHADVVSAEHLLSTLMDDEESAAHRAVLHAFADPATISDEALAISPGLMVVASGSTLPFSARAANVLARAHAQRAASGLVEVRDLLEHAERELADPLREALRARGYAGPGGGAERNDAGAPPPLGPELFRHFSTPAKRALSAANRLAAGERARSIAPAHLLLGCLREEPDAAGIAVHRVREALAGRSADESAPRPRSLPPDRGLLELLEGIPEGSDSLALLARFHAAATPELAAILVRSKVTAAFLERARAGFRDPDDVKAPAPPRR
jgi:hypothetical protein